MSDVEKEFLEETSSFKIKPNKRKKGINGKKKGNNFELTICHMLEERFKGVHFKRVPGSGSFLGGLNTAKSDTYNKNHLDVFAGDIFCSDENFKFTIECKARNMASFWDFFNESELFEWMRQAEGQAKITGKKPLLIVKYNNKPPIVYSKEELGPEVDVLKVKDWYLSRFNDFMSQGKEFFF